MLGRNVFEKVPCGRIGTTGQPFDKWLGRKAVSREVGRREWHTRSGYSKRSKVETTFSRYKAILGPAMRARRLASQRVEASIGCKILNIMTELGMPDGYMLG